MILLIKFLIGIMIGFCIARIQRELATPAQVILLWFLGLVLAVLITGMF